MTAAVTEVQLNASGGGLDAEHHHNLTASNPSLAAFCAFLPIYSTSHADRKCVAADPQCASADGKCARADRKRPSARRQCVSADRQCVSTDRISVGADRQYVVLTVTVPVLTVSVPELTVKVSAPNSVLFLLVCLLGFC